MPASAPLTRAARHAFATLRDAITLAHADGTPALLLYATDAPPVTVTRAALAAQAQTAAHGLAALGIGAGDVVVIAQPQALSGMYAFWGALLLGAIPSMAAPLSGKLHPARYNEALRTLLVHNRARFVLSTDAQADALNAVLDATPLAGSAWGETRWSAHCATVPAAPLPPAPTPDAIAFLQHSSGTTGLQKGVALSHRAVLNQLAAYAEALPLYTSDRIASWLPLYHDMGLIAAFIQPLVQGVPLVLLSPFDWAAHPALLLRAIHETRATLCWLPNFAYNHMAGRIRRRDSDGLDVRSIRAWINCSEPVRHDSHQRFLERFADNGVHAGQFAASYAMAENTFAVTQTPVGEPAHVLWLNRAALQGANRAVLAPEAASEAAAHVSCGRAIAGTEVRVIDPSTGDPLPDGCTGELCIRGDSLFSGYYRRDDLRPFDAEGWYHTGDLGFMWEGAVYVVGRSKDLIIVAGKNLFPQDLEALVYHVSGVHPGRAVVFGVPDAREGTELIAVVAEADTDDEAERQRIAAAIRLAIAQGSDVVASFVAVVGRGWLVKTSSGKTARAANREKWLSETQRASLPSENGGQS
jgi:acyl-CoA synthetase (AMP-forming)/AMP-acid ligase II